jgi:hypothetical protein
MPLADLFEFENVRRALVLNFGWLIHTSPEVHIQSIRDQGLVPNRDAPIPADLNGILVNRRVLCLHPLGAKLCPPAACNTIERHADTKMVTYAVKSECIPRQMHIDWSNAWEIQRDRFDGREALSGEEMALYLAINFGSVVSYEIIKPEKIRVFCNGNSPSNPLTWAPLLAGENADIVRYKQSP